MAVEVVVLAGTNHLPVGDGRVVAGLLAEDLGAVIVSGLEGLTCKADETSEQSAHHRQFPRQHHLLCTLKTKEQKENEKRKGERDERANQEWG